MPINSVHKSKSYVDYIYEGTQFIDNEVIFPSVGTGIVDLPRNMFGTGTYALFDYSTSTAIAPVQNLSNCVLDISDLLLADAWSLYDDTARKVVTATLYGRPTNGTQYVEGTLTINGPFTIYLSLEMFAATGTYVLFTYGSFVGSTDYVTVVPPPGREIDTSVSPNGVMDTGNSITVTLV